MSAEDKPEASPPAADSADTLQNYQPDSASPENSGEQADSPDQQEAAAEAAEVLDFGEVKLESEPVAEPDLSSDKPDLEVELAAAKSRADEHWERILRMQADMENQRKRSQRDIESARKFALEGMVNDLLPVRDSLEMGLAAARETDADAEKIIEGSDLTLKMLAQAFEKYNISEIDPLDAKFDPELHQAMSMQEVEGKEPNTVTGVLQKGYALNGRLLRPALVMVAK